jgi:phenylacetate-coenzyme A ligase PaaK-like adenylate-forming protein
MKKYIAQILTRLKSRGRYGHLSLMREYEYKPISGCRKFQKGLLFNILDYSIKNVPYYNEIAKKNELKIFKDSIFEDIKKFPILDKEILRDQFANLKSTAFEDKYFENTSGGSTGEPVVFLQDIVHSEKGKAAKILFDEWAGRKDGEKKIKLWGSERDILEGSQGINGLINTNLLNIILLNSFRMSEKDMKKYVEIINKEKPKIIEAYVQSVYELSKFIVNNKLQIYSPKGIITSAGTLYPDQKKLIEEVFSTKVYNRYGSREVGDMACSCEKDEGLHLNIFDHYIEILNDKLEPCKPDEIGQIYVTTLNNHVMPLIRYKIGDMAVPAEDEQCSCGRGLPLIKKVVGREVNLFKTKESTLIDGEYFTHLFYFKDWIRKFQVVQKRFDLIKVYIVLNDKKNKVDLNEIIYKIEKVMGQDCNVEFEFVDDIESLKSGKYLYTISEVK